MPKNPVIFESPDGGHTVYQREIGSDHRELIIEDSTILTQRERLVEKQLWHNILEASRSDAVLRELLDRALVYYELKK
jgi:hypothetical protein